MSIAQVHPSAQPAGRPYLPNGTGADPLAALLRRKAELEAELRYLESGYTFAYSVPKTETLDAEWEQVEREIRALERAREVEFRQLWDGDAAERREEALSLARQAYQWQEEADAREVRAFLNAESAADETAHDEKGCL